MHLKLRQNNGQKHNTPVRRLYKLTKTNSMLLSTRGSVKNRELTIKIEAETIKLVANVGAHTDNEENIDKNSGFTSTTRQST